MGNDFLRFVRFGVREMDEVGTDGVAAELIASVDHLLETLDAEDFRAAVASVLEAVLPSPGDDE